MARILQSLVFRNCSQNALINSLSSNTERLTSTNFLLQLTRSTSFFNKLPAEDLWRGVTAVSNAGKKRGRGKGSGRKIAKDLNKGQSIGVGKKSVVWPGLNSPIIRGKDIIQQQRLPDDTERENKIIKLRDAMGYVRLSKLNPIDRGWSGSKMPGRSIGAPDMVKDESFDTRVLENKIVFIMKGNMGRKRRYSVLCVTGNGKGVAGFAIGKAPEVRTALRKSKNRSAQKLISIKLCENRTVFHDFYTAFGKTKIFVTKKPDGYGLVCHRAIQTMCKVIGIKDLHAKIEGSTNLQNIVKAFFIGLLKQKSYEEIAEKEKMYIVEFRKDQNNIPQIVSSPSYCKAYDDQEEVISFNQYVLDNEIVFKRKKYAPWFVKSKGYDLYLRKQESKRNQDKVRLEMLVNNGQIKSFLSVDSECSATKDSNN